MSNYFVCVGGTGARIGEAFVYLAATGYFNAGKTKIWIIDKDTKCGNGASLRTAYERYSAFRKNCLIDANQEDENWFSQDLSLFTWDFDHVLMRVKPGITGDSAFKELGSGDSGVQKVMNFLHDASSLDNTMARGFYGRAQTGTTLYEVVRKTDEFSGVGSLFQDVKSEVDRGETPKVYFTGSSFGATGASLLPNMAKTMREQFGNKVEIGAVLMMPYFTFGGASKSENLVSAETHRQKAQEALRYYGNGERMTIRNRDEQVGLSGKVMDAFYVVGCEPLQPINNSYCDGGENQRNDSHIAELYAAMGAKHFFNLKPEEGKNGKAIYSYALSGGDVLDWNNIDPSLMRPMVSLTRFCLASLTYLYPLTHIKGKLTDDDTLKKWFGKSGMFGGPAQINDVAIRECVKFASEFSKVYLDYIYQISGVGPNVKLLISMNNDDWYSNLEEKLAIRLEDDKIPYHLRDYHLATDYTEYEKEQIYSACKLNLVRINVDTVAAPLYRNPHTAILTGEVLNRMKLTKYSGGAANGGKDNYEEHSRTGMKVVFKAVYDYCATLPIQITAAQMK